MASTSSTGSGRMRSKVNQVARERMHVDAASQGLHDVLGKVCCDHLMPLGEQALDAVDIATGTGHSDTALRFQLSGDFREQFATRHCELLQHRATHLESIRRVEEFSETIGDVRDGADRFDIDVTVELIRLGQRGPQVLSFEARLANRCATASAIV